MLFVDGQLAEVQADHIVFPHQEENNKAGTDEISRHGCDTYSGNAQIKAENKKET